MTDTVSPPVVEPLTDARGNRRRWTELAGASGNIFSTWEWAQTWVRHFGSGQEIDPIYLRDPDGATKTVLPLLHERRAHLRVTRFLGHGVGDELAPVCAPGDRETAIKALAAVAAERSDLLLAERLPSSWPREHLGSRVLKEEASPVICLEEEGDWDSYLAARSANFRQQVRRRARDLQRLGVSFRLADDPARLNDDFGRLIALHRQRWGGRSHAFAGHREAFHREFAAVALRRGWLRLWIAEAEGATVAAWYGFRFGGIESFYQAGRDPNWDRARLGAGLLEHSIREAFADGMREYRLLRGDETYKRRYASRSQSVVTLAVAQGPLSHGVVRVAEALAHRPKGRRLLASLSG
jgi:CelD/BcsL family acetyltransferase involved in cellulose biosynthesis